MSERINGDLTKRAVVDTQRMEWTSSPSGTVWRKRVHRVGPAEAGQVTSVVRYEPNASFPAHDHPEGEEIFVLDGVFQDEHGDWPAGTYLLNPEGFRHAPRSEPGCLLFVKLRQFPGTDRVHVATNTNELAWRPSEREGVEVKPLYEQTGFSDTMRLERWAANAALDPITFERGAELFVIDGSFENDDNTFAAGTWLRFPLGDTLRPRTKEGCTLYVKTGGFAYLA